MKTSSQRGSRRGMTAALAAMAFAAGCSSSGSSEPGFMGPTSDDSGGSYGGSSSGTGMDGSGGMQGSSGDGGGGSAGCGITEEKPNCEACLQAYCCAPASACAGDGSCSALFSCLAAAPAGDAGVSACYASATSAARQEYTTFASCMKTSCAVSCTSCHGTPPACSSRATETACTAAGCTWGGTCVGAALACPGLNQSQCGVQQNCTYDNATGQCSGTADSCSVLTAQYGCTTQQGCSWQTGCSGVPTPCTSLSDSASCTGAGCVWN